MFNNIQHSTFSLSFIVQNTKIILCTYYFYTQYTLHGKSEKSLFIKIKIMLESFYCTYSNHK